MDATTGFKDIYGNDVLSYEYVQQLRDEDRENKKKNFLAAQVGGQESILSSIADISITGGSRGGPLMKNTRILTPKGYKRICDINEGDEVYTPACGKQIVTHKMYFKDLPCYRVIMEDGASVIASHNHDWDVSTSSGSEWKSASTETMAKAVDIGMEIYIPMCNISAFKATPCAPSRRFRDIAKQERRRVKKCVFMGDYDCYCISVSGEDHLFVTEGFIVTHNSKSFSILLEAVKDIKNPNFSAIILRHEKPDLENIIEDSKKVFKDYGTYISSDKSMYWDLNSGGRIRFSFHAGDYDDFKVRFQGKQYSYIAIDEITHITWEKFLYLSTCLRNAHGIRNRIVGSCNPDSESWVARFISWWIGQPETVYADGQLHPELDGFPIPERNGKIRYCCMLGAEGVSDIVWGNSRDEVYELCKDKISELWTPDMEQYGDPKDLFILSVSFVEAKLTDNRKLLEEDPGYLSRLANQTEEQVQRDLRGNWHFKAKGSDYITMEMMEQFFKNAPQWGDGIHRMSMDVAFQGGDNNWAWHLVGNHIVDVDVAAVDAKNLEHHTKQLLSEWGVQEENFTYDSNGVGQYLKGYFRMAIPFNNLEAPYAKSDKDRDMVKRDFDTLKSQCVFGLADAIKYGELSIAPSLLDRRFSGKGFENKTLRDILMEERRCIKIDQRKAEQGKGKCLIQKEYMKKLIHRSPDALESLAYSRIFWVKAAHHSIKPMGQARYVGASGSYGGTTVGRRVAYRAKGRRTTRYI